MAPQGLWGGAPWRGFVLGGIDEAGRGPVFGPLVIAGVSGVDQASFRDLGVRDSKVLREGARTALEPEVRRVARRVEVLQLSAGDIDRRRKEETLNEIEVSAFAWIARRLKVEELFVDAADVDAARFGRGILRHFSGDEVRPRVVSEHRADSTYPVVSAASVVAKVTRDREVRRLAAPLEADLGLPLGSGYPSDPVTVRFLRAYRERFGRWPDGTRHTWETIGIWNRERSTRKLEEFLR